MLAGMRGRLIILLILIGLVFGGGGGYLALFRSKAVVPAPVETQAVRDVWAQAQIRYASVELPPLPATPEKFGPVQLSHATPSPLWGEGRGEGAVASMLGAKGPLTLTLSPAREGALSIDSPALRGGGRGDKKDVRVVVIIDDMGMNLKHSREILNLSPPLTLSFLPYAPRVAKMAAAAKAKGHQLMIHMPMQAINPALDLGSIALREGMSDADFDAMLDRAFHSFDGYVGMNNHMGSRLTQDRVAMGRLMAALKKRNLLFVDSRTIASSVAADEAAKAGVAYASRDVFLDDNESVGAIRGQLREVEAVARRTGVAIAIGHPYAGTVEALKGWLPTLKEKGIVMVPVSAVVDRAPQAKK